jgi:uncharacterized membrane protein
MPAILLIQLAATWFMVGLIWVIQIVHYPLFADVGEAQFEVYSQKHQFLITFIVGPVMVAEMITAVMLAWYPPEPAAASWLRVALVLLLVIWISTALIQAPSHGRLAKGFDLAGIRSLVNGNWIRTVAWTARGGILLVVLNQLLSVRSG